MSGIKVALLGVGNCASSLVQGIQLCTDRGSQACTGLLHENLGGYLPSDIQVVAALDIDRRKVGMDLAQAIFAPPNCTTVFYPEIAPTGVIVQRGCTLDGVAEHMKEHPEARSFVLSDAPEPSREQVIHANKRMFLAIIGRERLNARYQDRPARCGELCQFPGSGNPTL
jgi:myo-inositol-1-phosphate synthase